MSNPCLDAVIQELDKAEVPYRVDHGGKHLRVMFGHEYDHLHVVSATPSDRRAYLNERAQIRRSLRDLGYSVEDDEMPTTVPLELYAGHATCFSYLIADHFSKAHKDVLRAIDKIREECGPEFDRRNFTPIDYVDPKGRKYRAYRLTRDGFSLVVMGFTGSAATGWKVKYIEAFNNMDAELRRLAVIDHHAEIDTLRTDFEALSSLVFETAGKKLVDSREEARRQPVRFIRPSIIRREKRLRRAS
jgi:Rha family phage regulatory protein